MDRVCAPRAPQQLPVPSASSPQSGVPTLGSKFAGPRAPRGVVGVTPRERTARSEFRIRPLSRRPWEAAQAASSHAFSPDSTRSATGVASALLISRKFSGTGGCWCGITGRGKRLLGRGIERDLSAASTFLGPPSPSFSFGVSAAPSSFKPRSPSYMWRGGDLQTLRSGMPGLQFVVDAFGQQPASWQSSLAVTSTVFALGFPALAAGLSVWGIGAAYILGLLVWRGFGFQGFITVCLYFIIGTAVTKVRMKQKEAEGIAEKKKGRRGPGSVVGSGFAAALCSLAAVWLGVDSASVGSAASLFRLLQLGFVSSFCTKLSDTTSSEIGKAYGRSTYLVTTLAPVPRGTEGAVSLEGTLAGLVAAVVLALAATGLGEVSLSGAVICVLASQVANYGESYIGATLQDKPGYAWLSNDVVNVFNVMTGAALAMAVCRFLPLL